jgi:hypothetical protein
MDAFHPWTKYEIARIRDEERLLRARDAGHLRAIRDARGEELEADGRTSWLDRLRRREVAMEKPTATARPV